MIRRSGSLKGRPQIIKTQRPLRPLVIADAGRAAAAMIPENADAVIRRVVFRAITQKISQRIRRPHIGVRQLLQRVNPVLIIKIPAHRPGRDSRRVPLYSASCLNKHPHIGRQLHLQQFLYIRGSRAAFALQIGAANIPVDRPRIGRLIRSRRPTAHNGKHKKKAQHQC